MLRDLLNGCTRERMRVFVRSREWLWLPAVATVSFVSFLLLRRFGEGLPMREALANGGIYAAVMAFCWAVGIWAAADTRPNPYAERARRMKERGEEPPEPSWTGRIVIGGALLLFFLVICWPQIEGWYRGDVSLARALTGMLFKAAAIGAIVLPGWLKNKRGA